MRIKIDLLKCVGCGNCVPICPVGVLSVIDMKIHVEEGCISCGACVDTCTFRAITLEDKAVGKTKLSHEKPRVQEKQSP